MSTFSEECPLCGLILASAYFDDGTSRYSRCPECTLIFRDPAQWPTAEQERSRYLLHANDASHAGYVAFLRQLADAVTPRLEKGACGLDFGCGPTPVLSSLLADAGFPCEAYDPFFAPDEELLRKVYAFVVCSEVAEHLHDPGATLALFGRLLERGGVLGVMTRFYPVQESFATWWYRRDSTHVCFYAESTMRWIANRYGWAIEFPGPHITVFSIPDAR